WRIYTDPEVVDGWTVEQLGSVLVHHAGHLLRDHAARAEALGISEDDTDHWVSAADAEINDDLKDCGLDPPEEPVLPEALGCDEGHLAEEYFQAVKARQVESRSCGSGADGRPKPFEEEGAGDAVSDTSADLLRRQTASDVIAHGKEAGHVPAGLQRWAE